MTDGLRKTSGGLQRKKKRKSRTDHSYLWSIDEPTCHVCGERRRITWLPSCRLTIKPARSSALMQTRPEILGNLLIQPSARHRSALFRDGKVIFFQCGNVASNSLQDIGNRFFFGLSLAQTPRKTWAVRHPITILAPKNNHPSHGSPDAQQISCTGTGQCGDLC